MYHPVTGDRRCEGPVRKVPLRHIARQDERVFPRTEYRSEFRVPDRYPGAVVFDHGIQHKLPGRNHMQGSVWKK
jgi:hypothetical protein